jgi:hypothetical protein
MLFFFYDILIIQQQEYVCLRNMWKEKAGNF